MINTLHGYEINIIFFRKLYSLSNKCGGSAVPIKKGLQTYKLTSSLNEHLNFKSVKFNTLDNDIIIYTLYLPLRSDLFEEEIKRLLNHHNEYCSK